MTTRFRSNGALVAGGTCIETRNGSSVTYTRLTGKAGSVKSMTDNHDLKALKAARASGMFVMNAMDSTEVQSSYSGTGQVITDFSGANPVDTWSMTGPWGAALINLYMGNGVDYPEPVRAVDASRIAALVDEVCTDCASDYGRSTYDMWENVAELKQTVDMLSDPVQSVAQLYKSLRKEKGWAKVKEEFLRTFRVRKGESKKDYYLRQEQGLRQLASGQWLKYRYGIMPLVATVNDVVASVKSETEASEKIQTWRASRTIEEGRSGSQSFVNSSVTGFIDWTTNHQVKIRATAAGRTALTNAFKFGFCSKSLFTLPWELVRLSFVADWVGNIGSVIGSLAPAGEASMLGACYTVEEIVSTTFTVRDCRILPSWPNPNRRLIQAPGGMWTVTKTTKKRVVGFPPPRLLIRDSFKMSPKRTADALALLSQMLDGAAKHLLGDSSTKKRLKR